MRRPVVLLLAACALGFLHFANEAELEAPPLTLEWSSTCAVPLTARFDEAKPGLVASWQFPRQPPVASCEVRFVPDGGASRNQTGPVTLVDARGRRFPVEVRREAEAFSMLLPSTLLERVECPCVLDPLVTPLVQASVSEVVSLGRGARVVSDGTTWLAMAGDLETHLTAVGPDGRVRQRGSVAGGARALLYTDQFRLLYPSGVRSGRSWEELMDAGVMPLGRDLTNEGSVTATRPSGALWVVQGRAVDGGDVLLVRELAADLSWDGGEVVLDAGRFSQAAVEGSVEVLAVSDALGATRLYVLSPSGQVQGELTLPPGAALQHVVSNGVDRTLVAWSEFDAGATRVYAAVSSGGAWLGGAVPLSLDAWTISGVWAPPTFRLFSRATDGGGLMEQTVSPAGAAGPLEVLTQSRMWGLPVMVSASGAVLMVWSRTNVVDRAERVTLATRGATVSLDGGDVLFFAPNRSFFPSLAVRGEALLAVWNDTRSGSSVIELWARRFTRHLQPLDADSFTTNPGHAYGNPGWWTSGPGTVVSTDAGYSLVQNTSFDIYVHLLDVAGRARAAPVRVSQGAGLVAAPYVAATRGQTLAVFSDLNRWLAVMVDEAGNASAPLDLGPFASDYPVGVLGAEDHFLVVFSSQVRRVSLRAALEPSGLAVPPRRLMSATLHGDGVLGVFEVDDAGMLAARMFWRDGGVSQDERVPTRPGRVEHLETASDSQHAYVLVKQPGDGGLEVQVTRREPDAGWLAAVTLGQVDYTLDTQFAAVPDAGLVVAVAPRGRGGTVQLQRVVWLEPGDACGADGDCTSGHCVDGVCCDTACGGGALDCQACARASGAVADGTCALLGTTATCRGASGLCDVPEACDGLNSQCPVDGFADAGVTCEVATLACEQDSRCTGTDSTCPGVSRADAGTCTVDAGAPRLPDERRSLLVSCGCAQDGAAAWLLGALLVFRPRRQR